MFLAKSAVQPLAPLLLRRAILHLRKSECSMETRWSRLRWTLSLAGLVAALLLAGCGESGQDQASKAKAPLPSVVVEPVTATDVAGTAEFVGRTEASQRVDVRARVSGTLLERPFEQGANVNKDALLFKIDPAEFDAALASAKASLARNEAGLLEADRNFARYDELLKRETASVAQYDTAKAKAEQAKADVEAAKADVQRAELDLGYTTIVSPIAGRTGLATVDVGNIIGPDSGVLVTVLDLDPLYVYFPISESQYLNYMQAVKDGKAEPFIPRIKLSNDSLYAEPGEVDLIDNKVDPTTGTISVRLKFPNPDALLLPGQYANVILTSEKPEKRIVIPQVAVQENQAGPFVLIVNGEGRVEARPIKTGQRIETGIVVDDGLVEGETLIVEGIQKVHPGAEVDTVPRGTADEPEYDQPDAGP
jgi:membrane fusion protein, multidrug efflux system